MGEWIVRRSDQESRLIEVTGTANIMKGRHLAVIRDITERRRAEATRMRLAAIVESLADAVVVEDTGGVIREFSSGAEVVFGCSAAYAVGRKMIDFAPLERHERFTALRRRILAGEPVPPTETVRRRADGTTFDALEVPAPLRDPAGDIVGCCIITRDISETTELRTRVAIADRMASVGILAAGVAHEINNPLAAVLGNLELVVAELVQKVEVEGDDFQREALEAVQDALIAAGRVRDIVRDLKLFSRPEDEKRGPVDIRPVLDASIKLVRNEIHHRARLIQEHAEGAFVDASEGRLGQVFLNLLVNAAYAIPEGDAENNEIRIRIYLQGARVCVEFTDTGSGIPAEQLAHIFEPFFTTKPVGVGTGLGLSICRGIVDSLGGTLEVESTVGVGSTFRLWLPLCDAPLPAGARAERTNPVRARILVIDDDAAVARALTATLRRHHDVVTTTDARQALRWLDGGGEYDLILCDLMMPDLTGMDFFDAVSQRFPSVAPRVVFLTAGAFTPRAQEFLRTVQNPKLEKPIDLAELEALIAKRFG